MKNPVFFWAHKSGEPPIGKTLSISKETNPPALVQKVQFATKRAVPVRRSDFPIVPGEILKSAVTVGFIPLEKPTPILDEEGRSTGGYEFTSQELLELSAVPIPANPEAVARAIDQRIIRADDAERFFVTAKSPDVVKNAERFFHALDQTLALVEKGVVTPEDGRARSRRQAAGGHRIRRRLGARARDPDAGGDGRGARKIC